MNKRSHFTVMARLIGLVRPLAGFMCLAVIMGLIGHLCAAFITILGVQAVSHILHPEWSMNLGWLFAAMVIMAAARAGLRYGEQACNHFIAFKLLALLRDKVFRALRRLCPAKLEGRDRGDLISIITSDIELLEVFYAHTISPVCIAILFCVILCAYIGSFHWSLAVIAGLAYATVGILLPLAASRKSGDSGLKFRIKSGDLSSFVLDSLRGLPEILQFGQGNTRLNEMDRRTDALASEEEKLKRTAGHSAALTNTVILIFDLAMLFAASALDIAPAAALAATVALMSSFGPVVALANLGATLQPTFAAGNRVLDILDESPAVEEITGRESVTFSGAKAENVTFSYENEKILDNFSVTLPENRIIGITGRSGSGKSTLLKLFMRFWETQDGRVTLSGRDVSDINTADLRNMESYVTQDTHLFHDSIRNNIRIAKLDATDGEIVEACKKASVHDFIMTLPRGYDTEVGELGDTLSGGERQRLGLARAFLHDAPFMLLDEPTSNLDSLNEAVILRSLHQECQNKTVALISHRASTMAIAHQVYSVEHGRIS